MNVSIAGSAVRYAIDAATVELLLEPDGRWGEVIEHCPEDSPPTVPLPASQRGHARILTRLPPPTRTTAIEGCGLLPSADQSVPDRSVSTARPDSHTVSNTQVRMVLEGQPEAVIDEVVRINARARNQALGLALVTVGAVGLFGLAATFFLPGRSAGGTGRQPDVAGEARSPQELP